MFKVINYWLCFFLRKIKTNKTPELSADLMISSNQSSNVLTIYILIRHYFYIKLDDNHNLIFVAIIFIVIGIINHIVLLRKSAREAFFNQYESTSDKRKVRDKFIFWIYMIVSVPLFFIVLYYIKPYVN